MTERQRSALAALLSAGGASAVPSGEARAGSARSLWPSAARGPARGAAPPGQPRVAISTMWPSGSRR